ncbi:MAG: GDP-mannose 4,6-dehydratase [Clostridia bacterium]|nr:GDP-mannose 4,6-dehydratase [Clostridia bacterium]
MKVILVTGGAGFIGSNFIRYFLRRNKNFIIVNLDKLTGESDLDNLKEFENSPRHHFIKGDIVNHELVSYVIKRYRPDYIINFAAVTRKDAAVNNAAVFVETNILGTLTLMESARYYWGKGTLEDKRFIHISTAEVYGKNDKAEDYLLEESLIDPGGIYSASKAGADLLVRAYSKSYKIPVIITRSCQNYGPYQNVNEFIPNCIKAAIEDRPITVNSNTRSAKEYVHVVDHAIALIRTMFYGKAGETYNIGSGECLSEIEIARKVLNILGKPEDRYLTAEDREVKHAGSILNSYKIRNNLSWSSKVKFEEGIKDTVRWYKENRQWWSLDD